MNTTQTEWRNMHKSINQGQDLYEEILPIHCGLFPNNIGMWKGEKTCCLWGFELCSRREKRFYWWEVRQVMTGCRNKCPPSPRPFDFIVDQQSRRRSAVGEKSLESLFPFFLEFVLIFPFKLVAQVPTSWSTYPAVHWIMTTSLRAAIG